MTPTTPITPILWYQTVWFEIGKAIVLLIVGGLITYFFGRLSHKKDRKESNSKALSTENADLKKRLELYEEVEQSQTGNYLIMKKNGWAICPVCWGKDQKPVQIFDNGGGRYLCGGCGKGGIFNHQRADSVKRQSEYDNAHNPIHDIIYYDPYKH